MSFVERNKAWLLPLLGVAALGVLAMNLRMFSGKSPAQPTTIQPVTPIAAPVAVAPPAGAPAAGGDLWKDLQALETPSEALTGSASLMRWCAATTTPTRGAHARTDPDRWKRATDPPVVQSMPKAGPVPEPKAAPVPLPPAPELSFIAQTPHGLEAWFAGHPYQEGAHLPDGRRIRRITPQQVLLEGPGGRLERSVHALVPRSVPPQEIP